MTSVSTSTVPRPLPSSSRKRSILNTSIGQTTSLDKRQRSSFANLDISSIPRVTTTKAYRNVFTRDSSSDDDFVRTSSKPGRLDESFSDSGQSTEDSSEEFLFRIMKRKSKRQNVSNRRNSKHENSESRRELQSSKSGSRQSGRRQVAHIIEDSLSDEEVVISKFGPGEARFRSVCPKEEQMSYRADSSRAPSTRRDRANWCLDVTYNEHRSTADSTLCTTVAERPRHPFNSPERSPIKDRSVDLRKRYENPGSSRKENSSGERKVKRVMQLLSRSTLSRTADSTLSTTLAERPRHPFDSPERSPIKDRSVDERRRRYAPVRSSRVKEEKSQDEKRVERVKSLLSKSTLTRTADKTQNLETTNSGPSPSPKKEQRSFSRHGRSTRDDHAFCQRQG